MAALILVVLVGLTIALAGLAPWTAVFSPAAGPPLWRWLLLAGVLWLLAGRGQKQA